MTFKITVTTPKPIDELHELDRDVAGTYKIDAPSEEAALDQFHNTVPIKVLDDFYIDAERGRRGLMVSVMGSDCTNGGVTSGVEHVVLVGDGIAEIFDSRDGMPAVGLEYDLEPQGCRAGQLTLATPRWLKELGELGDPLRDFNAIHGIDKNGLDHCGQHRMVRVVARPFNEDGTLRKGGMFGGNYVTCCDSRFPTSAPIPVHDRFE